MRILITGGTGALGRQVVPLARAAGHDVQAPGRAELDLFDPAAVGGAVAGRDAILHLATRIPPRERMDDRSAWDENDRLRTAAVRHLVDAALAAAVQVLVLPTVTFVYPPDAPADEDAPIGDVPDILRSALAAEAEVARLVAAGRRAPVLRLGLLDGPGTGNDAPVPDLGATLHVVDAAEALLLALDLEGGIWNVCRDGERVRNGRFAAATGWHPRR